MEFSKLNISVSLVPGPPPLTSTAAEKGLSLVIIVTPVPISKFSAWPTCTPVTSVIRLLIPGPEQLITSISIRIF